MQRNDRSQTRTICRRGLTRGLAVLACIVWVSWAGAFSYDNDQLQSLSDEQALEKISREAEQSKHEQIEVARDRQERRQEEQRQVAMSMRQEASTRLEQIEQGRQREEKQRQKINQTESAMFFLCGVLALTGLIVWIIGRRKGPRTESY